LDISTSRIMNDKFPLLINYPNHDIFVIAAQMD
jgi:hypothetical protein